MTHENQEPPKEKSGSPSGRGESSRHPGNGDIQPLSDHHPAPAQNHTVSGKSTEYSKKFPSNDPTNIYFNTQVNHQELTQYFPEPQTAAELKHLAPEVYKAWIETTKDTIKTDNYIRKSYIRNPKTITLTGQYLGALVVFGVLTLAAFAASRNMPVLTGFLATIDVVALAAIFAGNQGKSPKD